MNLLFGQESEFSVTQMLVAGGVGGVLNVMLGSACFTTGSLIMVPVWDHSIYGETPPVVGWTIGWQAIQVIEEGDWVLAKDENNPNGPLVPKRVLQKFRRWGESAKLRVWGREIGTTKEHPFYVANEGKWTAAERLEIGNRFLSHDGQEPAFEALEQTGKHENLYNLRIADYHTYFVGGPDWGFSVWAHNACTGATTGPKTDPKAPHNATIRALAGALKALGNKILAGGGTLKEAVVKTIGGFKDLRRPDILYQTPSGEIRAINVGRTMADGTPVPREVRALADLNGPGGIPTTFVPYTP